MIIAIHNTKGGVGSTTIAAHLCALIAEGDARVDGMSVDDNNELRRWLDPLGIRCLDPEVDLSHARSDHLVIDVQSTRRPPVAPDAWVIPCSNRLAVEHGEALADTLPGVVLLLPTMGRRIDPAVVPEHARGDVEVSAAIPYSRAVAEACDTRTIAWRHPELAGAYGVRQLRSALESLLALAQRVLEAADEAAPRPVAV